MLMNDQANDAHREYAIAKLALNRRNWRSAMLQTAESLETQAKVYRTMEKEGHPDRPSPQLFSMTVTAERDGRALRRALSENLLHIINEIRDIEEDLGVDERC